MVRLVFLALFMLLVVSGALAIRSCDARHQSGAAETPANLESAESIVGLPDGDTLVAAKGSVTRRLVDWLASGASSAAFEVGGREFLSGSVTPTAEGTGRIPRLAMMLRAYPDIDLRIVGHARASGNPAADLALSEARARLVARELEKAGIVGKRLETMAAGSTNPLPADSPLRAAGASDDRVSLVLTRRAR